MMKGMLFWIGVATLVVLLLAAVIWRRFIATLTTLAAILGSILLMNWAVDNGYWPQERLGTNAPVVAPIDSSRNP